MTWIRPGALAASGRIALAALVALSAVPAAARDPLAPLVAPIAVTAGTIDDFYATRSEPLWLTDDGRAAQAILHLFRDASIDGLDPARFDTGELRKALRNTQGAPLHERLAADRMLSQALVDFSTEMRTGVEARGDWDIGDPRVAPHALQGLALLESAAAANDRADWVEAMPWMHPDYVALRTALRDEVDPAIAATLRVNLDRTRILPAHRTGRYVLVNSAAQRLYMVEDGRVVDSMKVVVGKTDQPTPMLASMIDHADLNPYWNLPLDLVAERVAPNVVREGLSYLERQGYEVLDGFGEDARPVDPSTVDWKEAAADRLKLRMRQKPGPSNAMGAMKFMFANRYGVYLHDTPQKNLMANDARLASAGCVRLEDAPRLGAWLFGRPVRAEGAAPEQRADLPEAVPVYLAYLTAAPDEQGRIVFYDDIYGRDKVQMARR